jgi:mono/diheme cytochrome c family protein
MKKMLAISSLMIAVLICCVGFTTATIRQVGKTSTAARGKALYVQYCLVCHQADGGGTPNMFPPLVKTKYVLGDKKQLIKIVLNGLQGDIDVNGETYHNVMPPQATLTDQEIADILTFVRSSFTNKASAVKPAEVKAQRGKPVVSKQ